MADPTFRTRRAYRASVFRGQFQKTRWCHFFKLSGFCKHGETCHFAHSEEELSTLPDLSKTSLCKQWLQGTCQAIEGTCKFAHGQEELKMTSAFKSGRAECDETSEAYMTGTNNQHDQGISLLTNFDARVFEDKMKCSRVDDERSEGSTHHGEHLSGFLDDSVSCSLQSSGPFSRQSSDQSNRSGALADNHSNGDFADNPSNGDFADDALWRAQQQILGRFCPLFATDQSNRSGALADNPSNGDFAGPFNTVSLNNIHRHGQSFTEPNHGSIPCQPYGQWSSVDRSTPNDANSGASNLNHGNRVFGTSCAPPDSIIMPRDYILEPPMCQRLTREHLESWRVESAYQASTCNAMQHQSADHVRTSSARFTDNISYGNRADQGGHIPIQPNGSWQENDFKAYSRDPVFSPQVASSNQGRQQGGCDETSLRQCSYESPEVQGEKVARMLALAAPAYYED